MSKAVAPGWKPDPVMVTVTLPIGSGFGDIEVMTGPFVRRYTKVVAEVCGSALLAAVICTGFCAGIVEGAV